MLLELAVTDLGVIERLALLFGPGMTAVTGETGAGKTMVVEALHLLLGGRADPGLVRSGSDEAVVEGRFSTHEGDEVVVRRVIPRTGRSRAYVNGRLASANELAGATEVRVDLHGQHSQQSLFSAATQREVLDRFGGVDTSAMAAAAAEVSRLRRELDAMGGDNRARAREIDLLRFQLGELDAAQLTDADEDSRLDVEESALADATAHREAAESAAESLSGDGGALDLLGAARSILGGRLPYDDEADRLASVSAELQDIARSVRSRGEAIVDDPEALAELRGRRQLLRELRRKYGETLADVLTFQVETASRLDELTSHDERARALDRQLEAAEKKLAEERASVRAARVAASGRFGGSITDRLRELAMPSARVVCEVDGPDGGQVTLMLSANSGADLAPLARAASGGELARAMLAIRLVTSSGPPTLVFDEVDAGIGGGAASVVGQALARLADGRQVLVVTHLPQVAACADHHVAVVKHDDGIRTVTSVGVLLGDERLVELARMLSGSPDSDVAHRHAEELLATAAAARAEAPEGV